MKLVGRAAEALRRARHVCVLTGAGISAESGIPTFRDALTGLWAKFSPEELATPEAFERDPETVWSWYEWRRQLIRQAQPNAGHLALAELARRVPGLTLVTQNVDGLHQRAGSPRRARVPRQHPPRPLHGRADRRTAVRGHAAYRPAPLRGLRRPVAPGRRLVRRSDPGRTDDLAAAAAEECDVFLSVGTSSLVYPAAGLAEVALRRRATVIEINPNETDLSPHAHLVLRGPSGQILPALLQALG